MLESASDDRYWLPHKTSLWLPGDLTKRENESLTFQASNGEVIVVPVAEAANLEHVYPDQERGVEDICSLVEVNEASLLHTVRVRYSKKEIYTRVGWTLISVNPFATLPIYSSQQLERYTASANSMELPPHIFGIGQDAIRGLRETTNDQAVLISGESGAGKTESAKLIMSFVADAMHSSEGGSMERVLRTNVVLEAFGNAMTVRNNNSSRFGKWLDLRFSSALESLGATVTSYLLETTRVCTQGDGERGYHVFFQLLQARNHAVISELHLQEPRHYTYLKAGQLRAPGIDDSAQFENMKEALAAFGVDGNTQKEIFTVLAGILTLGNNDFKSTQDESAELVTSDTMNRTAEILKVDPDELSSLMLIRKIAVGKDVTRAKNRVDQARSVRDGLAKLLYNRLFQWLIHCMNSTLTGGHANETKTRLLGVLDIAGFECFEMNSLEQLLINLSNEHLQQHFNQSVIKSESEECRKEGVEMPDIEGFTDNANILALIDSKGGVLDLLDETCLANFSNATDMTFVNKVLQVQKSHERLICPKSGTKPCFGVKHFAGDVVYTCDGWLDKNVEKLPMDTDKLLGSSGLDLLKEFSQTLSDTTVNKGKKQKSVTSGFRTSLKELMTKIHAANPHYIRCVKPNMDKMPGRFEAQAVLEQLIFGGMLAAVNIRQQGYAYRVPHAEFVSLYRCIVEQFSDDQDSQLGALKAASDVQSRVKILLAALPKLLKSHGDDLPKDCFALGHTKVFARFSALRALDKCRQAALQSVAIQIQRAYRGVLCRRQVAMRRALREKIQDLLERLNISQDRRSQRVGALRQRKSTTDLSGRDCLFTTLGSSTAAMRDALTELCPLVAQAEVLDYRDAYVCDADWAQRRIRRELSSIETAQRLTTSIDIGAFEKALASLRQLKLADIEESQALEDRLAKLKVQLPLEKAMKTVLRERAKSSRGETPEDELARAKAWKPQLQDLVRRLDEAGLREDPAQWLVGLRGVQLADEVLEATQTDLELTDADGAKKLAAERAATQKLAAERAAVRQEEAKKAAEERGAKREAQQGAFAKKLDSECAAAEAEFASKLAAERATVEKALSEKLAAEQARADLEKEKEAAQQAAAAVEKSLMERIASERIAAEQEFAQRMKEVTDRLSAERAAGEARILKRLADEEAKGEASQKLAEKHAAAEHAAAKKLEELVHQRDAKEQEHAQELAVVRGTAEKELKQRLHAEKAAAEQRLEERCAAERKAAEEAVAETLAKQHAAAIEDLNKTLVAEHTQALDDNTQKLSSEHAAQLEEFRQKLAAEHAAAEHELEEKLTAEKIAAQAAERAAAEKKFAEELAAQHAAATEELTKKLAEERTKAEEQLKKKLAAERKAAQDEAVQKLTAEHAAAKERLELKLLADHVAAEEALAERLSAEHAAKQLSFVEELATEHCAAELELMNQLQEAKLKVDAAERLASETASQMAEAQVALEQEVTEKLALARAEAEQDFIVKLATARVAAEQEFEQRLAMQRRRKRSFAGFVVSERTQILDGLSQAASEYDAVALETLLGLAAADGIEDDGDDDATPLADAKELFEKLLDDASVLDLIDEVQDHAVLPEPPLLVLRQLWNLITQLERLQGLEEASEAQEVLQTALVRIARSKGLRSIFDVTDVDLLELANKVFGSLHHFSKLKAAGSWTGAGHTFFSVRRQRNRGASRSRAQSSASSVLAASDSYAVSEQELDQKAQEFMLSFSRDCIGESLTRSVPGWSPEEYDAGASLNFLNIIVCMGDKPVQDCQRLSCTEAVLNLASASSSSSKSPPYKDEIYIQVLKQLSRNPSTRSQKLGWQLLEKLISTAPPSDTLAEFLHIFIGQRAREMMDDPHTSDWAKEITDACRTALRGNSLWQRAEVAWGTFRQSLSMPHESFACMVRAKDGCAVRDKDPVIAAMPASAQSDASPDGSKAGKKDDGCTIC